MNLRHFIASILLSLSFVSIPMAAEARESESSVATEARPAGDSTAPPRTSFGARNEEARYAAREAASPDAKQFRGGDVIIISAGVLALILVIVLIIVLI